MNLLTKCNKQRYQLYDYQLSPDRPLWNCPDCPYKAKNSSKIKGHKISCKSWINNP